MKHILKFTGQLILIVLINLLWLYPYFIWHARKHRDHDEINDAFEHAYSRFKWNLYKGR